MRNGARGSTAIAFHACVHGNDERHHAQIVLFATTLLAMPVLSIAQRADVNAVTSADDAFGFSAAGETIGLYDSHNIRGFDPSRAGNVRIEGLYFDWQARFTDDVLDATRMRVGLSALDFPFASPSGIADYQLRHADGDSASGSVGIGPFTARALNFTWASRTRVAALVSASRLDDRSAAGGRGATDSVGVVTDIAVAEHARLTVFANHQQYRESQSDPTFYSSGAAIPAPIARGVNLSQPWVREDGANDNVGALWQADMGIGWTASAGVFYSRWLPWHSFDTIVTDVDQPGRAQATVYASADADNHSASGDLRVKHDWQWKDSRQVDIFSLRGRQLERRYGGEQEIALGAVDPDRPTFLDRPAIVYGAQDRAEIGQRILAWSHSSQWGAQLQGSFSVQHVHTAEAAQAAEESTSRNRHDETLFTASTAYQFTKSWLWFVGYTEGSESLGTAPTNASNRNQLLPGIVSAQVETGLRYKPSEQTLVAVQAFDLRRPFAGLASDTSFRVVGDLHNRGIEISASLKPVEGLTVLGGLLWMDARVRRDLQLGTVVADRPVGVATRQALLYADYELPYLSNTQVDAGITYRGRVLVDDVTALHVAARHSVNVGMRWSQNFNGHRLYLRAGIDNLFDEYSWNVDVSGGLQYSAPRSYSISLTAEL